jgi:Cdc6-like AAA superfamily ATPase
VGKTSLLRRIALELREGGLIPILFDLHGIDARTQPGDQVLRRFLKYAADAASDSSVQLQAPAAGSAGDDPLGAIEFLFEWLTADASDKKIVVMLDEFQNIVSTETKPLLDLFRRIYDQGRIWFVFCG